MTTILYGSLLMYYYVNITNISTKICFLHEYLILCFKSVRERSKDAHYEV